MHIFENIISGALYSGAHESAIYRCPLQIHLPEHLIFIILIDRQVSLRNLNRRMIVDGHDQRRGNPFLPSMVSKSLAQRMAADRPFQIQLIDRPFDNSKGNCAVDGLIFPIPALKKEILPFCPPFQRLFQQVQRTDRFPVQRDPVFCSVSAMCSR